MWGSDTLTTVVSSTSIKVANITATATIHGFTYGWGFTAAGFIRIFRCNTRATLRHSHAPGPGAAQSSCAAIIYSGLKYDYAPATGPQTDVLDHHHCDHCGRGLRSGECQDRGEAAPQYHDSGSRPALERNHQRHLARHA